MLFEKHIFREQHDINLRNKRHFVEKGTHIGQNALKVP